MKAEDQAEKEPDFQWEMLSQDAKGCVLSYIEKIEKAEGRMWE